MKPLVLAGVKFNVRYYQPNLVHNILVMLIFQSLLTQVKNGTILKTAFNIINSQQLLISIQRLVQHKVSVLLTSMEIILDQTIISLNWNAKLEKIQELLVI